MLKNMWSMIFVLLISSMTIKSSFAQNTYHNPFYIGITGGYGTTTWANLVPKELNAAMSLSTPTGVSEGGTIWGVYGGYEILPCFAFEGSYMRYPTAHLYFDEMSLFSFYHDGRNELTTRTESISIVGKIMMSIPCIWKLRAYSDFGAAEVHRYDPIVDRWRLSPTFGAGLNYTLNPNTIIELGTEYVAGYGQSELDPADHFIPFLYSGFLRLAYHF